MFYKSLDNHCMYLRPSPVKVGGLEPPLPSISPPLLNMYRSKIGNISFLYGMARVGTKVVQLKCFIWITAKDFINSFPKYSQLTSGGTKSPLVALHLKIAYGSEYNCILQMCLMYHCIQYTYTTTCLLDLAQQIGLDGIRKMNMVQY